MLNSEFIETVLGGLRPLALMCHSHEDVVLLNTTVKSWSNELLCASQIKESANTTTNTPKLQGAEAQIAAIMVRAFLAIINSDMVAVSKCVDELRQLQLG